MNLIQEEMKYALDHFDYDTFEFDGHTLVKLTEKNAAIDEMSPSSTALSEISRFVNEYEEKIRDGTSDPEHFMSISEIEELWSKLNARTNVLYSDLTESLLKQINLKKRIPS